MAHRFLNYLLDPKVALENFVGYVGYQPPITKIDAQALFDQQLLPEGPAQLRRHARGLRQRQRVPGADGGRPPRVGPGLGRVPQRLMKRAWAFLALPGMAWLAAFFLVAFYAIVAVGLGNITDLYEPVPHWNPLDWNVGYLLQAIDDVLPGRAHVGRVRAHAALRRGGGRCSRWRSAIRSPTTSRATRTGGRRRCCSSCSSRRSGSRT